MCQRNCSSSPNSLSKYSNSTDVSPYAHCVFRAFDIRHNGVINFEVRYYIYRLCKPNPAASDSLNCTLKKGAERIDGKTRAAFSSKEIPVVKKNKNVQSCCNDFPSKSYPLHLEKKKPKQQTTAWQSIIKFDPFPFGRIVGFWDEDRPRRLCFLPERKKKQKNETRISNSPDLVQCQY